MLVASTLRCGWCDRLALRSIDRFRPGGERSFEHSESADAAIISRSSGEPRLMPPSALLLSALMWVLTRTGSQLALVAMFMFVLSILSLLLLMLMLMLILAAWGKTPTNAMNQWL